MLSEQRLEALDYTVFQKLLNDFNNIHSIPIGPLVEEINNLKEGIPAYMKNALLITGKDLLKEIPLLSIEAVIKQWSRRVFLYISKSQSSVTMYFSY